MKVICSSCSYKVEKPKLEHLIYAVKKDKGSIIKNICPLCEKKLKLEG